MEKFCPETRKKRSFKNSPVCEVLDPLDPLVVRGFLFVKSWIPLAPQTKNTRPISPPKQKILEPPLVIRSSVLLRRYMYMYVFQNNEHHLFNVTYFRIFCWLSYVAGTLQKKRPVGL